MTIETYEYNCAILSSNQVRKVLAYLTKKYGSPKTNRIFSIQDIVDMVNELCLPIPSDFRQIYVEITQERIDAAMDIYLMMSVKHEININWD